MRIIAIVFLIFSNCVLGQEWRSSDGEFMAMVFLSDNPEEIYSDWENGPANKVKFSELPKIANGKAFEAIVIFTGCTSDINGNCNVVANWKIETLAGDSLDEVSETPLWVNRKAPISGQLQISEKGLGIVASKEDKGYLINVQVKDLVSGRSVNLIQKTIVEGS